MTPGRAEDETPIEHHDVVIVGAGMSGIGAACRLLTELPGKSFTILESRGAIGGTWDLFRYPGVRSDSDMYTFGFDFRPWTRPELIGDGESILGYIRDTAREYRVDEKIRFHHRVVSAEWSSLQQRWTVRAVRSDTAETVLLTCGFLYMCAGYYRYDEGYTPPFAGTEQFAGRLVHPQQWPADLDYRDKRVIVLGSGATAVTLVPTLAEKAAHVTMVQRSPSYVLSIPSRDGLADRLRGKVPDRIGYRLVRRKYVLLMIVNYGLSRRAPGLLKNMLRKGVQAQLPEDFDVDTHFSPRDDPWDQRLCFAADGDLFKALSQGRASMVTGQVDTFTGKGLRMASGEEFEADVIVTATGLNLTLIGGATLRVDGREVDLANTVAYKGSMLSGVPNLAFAFGYTNSTVTLKTDLVGRYVCRLLAHMDAEGYRVCTPVPPGPAQRTQPLIILKSGYVLRALDILPKQGTSVPWRLHDNYLRDVRLLRRRPIEDEGVRFTRARYDQDVTAA
jgi:cation diffusion facilitator CzcD-associated flavoprotein CzcO